MLIFELASYPCKAKQACTKILRTVCGYRAKL